jgi:hypothetical protein
VFEQAPLSEVIREIEVRTSYRFLYRDALISGRRVTLASDQADVFAEFRKAVDALGLDVMIDDSRGQVLLFARRTRRIPATVVTGSVFDSESGVRLPFATVSWHSASGLRGAVADDAGNFTLTLPSGTGPVDLTASFLGYRAQRVRVDPEQPPLELSIRLRAEPILASEVLVRGSMLYTDLDTAWHHLMQPGSLAPLGESGVLRSLQTLPSVAITPAVGEGLTVRGSRSDGFQVLLDGMPVYGESHLFGMFDAFNDDAIQAVGFFYGITPASYQAPPGGTLSFLTRSGSRSRLGGSASLSNTSVRGTAEGPLMGGSGSWLVSGRHSIISAVNWMGNESLVAHGLDVGREHSEPEVGVLLPRGGLEHLGDPEARYFDVHGKMVAESRRGDQFVLSAYFGGDRAALDAERILRLSTGQGQGQGGSQTIRRPADTDQRWGNATASASWKRPLGTWGVSSLSVGYTRFSGSYERADFVFPDTILGGRMQGSGGGVDWRIGTFASETGLDHWRIAESLTWTTRRGAFWSAGAEVNAYDNRYGETALERIGFVATQRSFQTDAYVGFATPAGIRLGMDAGLRAHHFGLGNRLGLSPRLDLRLRASDAIRLMLGASRNYQFLYRIALEHEPTVDIWSLSGQDEEPTRVDYATTGIHVRPFRGVFVQAEAFFKDYRNLRLHELTARYQQTSNLDVFSNPWLWNARGKARGIELMLRYDLGPVSVVHAYTRSRILLSHPDLGEGEEFPAYWDRPHQGSLSLRTELGGRVAATATWSIASGAPNTLASRDSTEAGRLPLYHRLDVTVSGRLSRGVSLRFGLFNAYDRRNVWYRAAVPVLVSSDQPGRLAETANVDMYDLGIQPSLEFTVRF